MATSPANIKLGGGFVYYGVDFVGMIAEDGITISVNGNTVNIFTSESGSTPMKTFSQGDTVEVKIKLREMDKYVLALALGVVSATGTNSATAEAGVLSAGREAGFVMPTRPLTIYPHFVDETTGIPLTDTVSNIWAFRIHRAVVSSEAEFLLSPSESVAPEITFMGQYDKTKAAGNRVYRWGSGLSPEAS